MSFRLVAPLAVAFAVAMSVSPTAAGAGGPLRGLEAMCQSQDGWWNPSALINDELVPACSPGELVIIPGGGHDPWYFASTNFIAIDSLCKAAGFHGVSFGGKSPPGSTDFIVFVWWCASQGTGVRDW